MPEKEFAELRLGHKTIYGIIEGETCTVMSDCSVDPEAVVKFTIPSAAAREIFSGERTSHIQDLLPDLRMELREVLISGTSPAEFDQIRGQVPRTLARFRRKYAPIGYSWDNE